MHESSLNNHSIPDTGISGVYEVMVGTQNPDYVIKYFGEFGFSLVGEGELEQEQAYQLYGHASGLKSYRLQNGSIDSHGLIRVLVWDKPLTEWVGYTSPRTIGQRMSVMRTDDIFRITDIYNLARSDSGEKWLCTEPVADDLYDMDQGKKGFFNRPIMVRENAVYGEFFSHVFFQRYGYEIPGYGTIEAHSPLKTSEFTHHDFIIDIDDMQTMSYLSTALGLTPEGEPELNGDWQKGPKQVFILEKGESHMYQGFVSPNNICGKLKFIIPTSIKSDRSNFLKVGSQGITLHSFYTSNIDMIHELVNQHQLTPSHILENEFGEPSFVFSGPAGCTWQIISKSNIEHLPKKELEIKKLNN